MRLKGSLGIVILAFFCCLVLHSCGEFIDQCGVEELCFFKGFKAKNGSCLDQPFVHYVAPNHYSG